MEYYFDNFIGTFNNYFPEDYIDSLITHFNQCPSFSRQSYEPTSPIFKLDHSVEAIPNLLTPEQMESHHNFHQYFNQVVFETILPIYYNKYPSLLEFSNQCECNAFKIQKTNPGEGFHNWHFEWGNKSKLIDRWGVYTLYLNDVEEGGETEYLHLHKRIQPKKGKLVIFPSGFTHTHRGNPPLKGSKYIVTGWFTYKIEQ